MTTLGPADQLARLGLEQAAVPMTASLYEKVLAGFRELSGDLPRHLWWVPGRLEVFGKHTDYAGGRTLVAALPRGFAVAASPRAGAQIHLLDAARGARASFEPGSASGTDWRRYAETVIRRLTSNFAGARGGLDLAFASNLPPSAGMSSSSALVVGIASALVRIRSIDEHADWRRNIPDDASRAMYLASIESGATYGTLEGDTGVGTHGGSEDHAAMLLGTARAVSAFSFVPLQRLGDARVPDGWQFVVASSGVTAEKTGAAREGYNRLSEGADMLLRLWNERHTPARSLSVALARHGAVDALQRIIASGNLRGWPGESLERRLAHFVREDGRILEALQAFHDRDRAAMTRLSEASQHDAEHLLGNQIPETIALVECAREQGAFATCSFGAGFGGGAWALVDRERSEAFARDWIDGYRTRYPVLDSQVLEATPGPPVVELQLP